MSSRTRSRSVQVFGPGRHADKPVSPASEHLHAARKPTCYDAVYSIAFSHCGAVVPVRSREGRLRVRGNGSRPTPDDGGARGIKLGGVDVALGGLPAS